MFMLCICFLTASASFSSRWLLTGCRLPSSSKYGTVFSPDLIKLADSVKMREFGAGCFSRLRVLRNAYVAQPFDEDRRWWHNACHALHFLYLLPCRLLVPTFWSTTRQEADGDENRGPQNVVRMNFSYAGVVLLEMRGKHYDLQPS